MSNSVQAVLRVLVLTAAAATALIGLTHTAARRRWINPFGGWATMVRRLSDPLLRPIERRVVRSGGNPQSAPVWLLGITIGLGIVVLTLAQWIFGWIETLENLVGAPPSQIIRFIINSTGRILMLSILVRVIASWFGVFDYSRWIRPFVWLTDWLIIPIRRRLPVLGPLDLSPIIAYFIIWFVTGVLLTFI